MCCDVGSFDGGPRKFESVHHGLWSTTGSETHKAVSSREGGDTCHRSGTFESLTRDAPETSQRIAENQAASRDDGPWCLDGLPDFPYPGVGVKWAK
jgi:hypothetical protein